MKVELNSLKSVTYKDISTTAAIVSEALRAGMTLGDLSNQLKLATPIRPTVENKPTPPPAHLTNHKPFPQDKVIKVCEACNAPIKRGTLFSKDEDHEDGAVFECDACGWSKYVLR